MLKITYEVFSTPSNFSDIPYTAAFPKRTWPRNTSGLEIKIRNPPFQRKGVKTDSQNKGNKFISSGKISSYLR